ncbi:hypothetical protein, partial [Burkholderia thailandensis]|uniref:hypothetical protein n=1 Tax=Burkholderia thailandensis TaxID=57975 RepID=UPI00217D3599
MPNAVWERESRNIGAACRDLRRLREYNSERGRPMAISRTCESAAAPAAGRWGRAASALRGLLAQDV